MRNTISFALIGSLLFSCSFSLQAAKKANEIITVNDVPILQQENQHPEVAKRITSRFTRSHFSDVILNQAFSDKVFERYLERIDFGKYLFLESEIENYKKRYAKRFADELRSGNSEIAFLLYNDTLKKRFEFYQYSVNALENSIRLKSDPEMNLDFKKISWAKNENELKQRWINRIKADEINLALTDKKPDEIKSTLIKRYKAAMARLTKTKSEDAFQVYMNAFAREIDPHTSYLAPRAKKQFNSDMSLSLEGIGAVLKMEDDYAEIVSMVKGGPAEKSSKLHVGDKIIGVGQTENKIEDVVGWRLDDVVDLIRGKKGSHVYLQVIPADNGKTTIIDIIREAVRLEESAAKSSVLKVKNQNIGVITIPSFYMGLTDNVKDLLTKLKKENTAGLIIDLRGNGGGSLSEVITLSGLFIDSGPIVQIKNAQKKVNRYDDSDGEIYYNAPLVVLVDRFSASASEIFAAALQDYGRAIIVGENTFGKGTVQTHQNLAHIYDSAFHPDWPELGAIQFTIQKFYRINGDSTQLKGVIPDIKMPTAGFIDEFGERFEDNALPWDSVEPAPYNQLIDFSSYLPELTAKHEARIKNNREFQYIFEDIEEYKKDENSRYIISLDLEKRKAEAKKYDDKKLARENERRAKKGLLPLKELKKSDKEKDDKDQVDPYLDESAEILLDLKSILAKYKH